MYPAVITNKLSFVWVGTQLPERYAANILDWAEVNPQYEIYLWTESSNIKSNAKLIADAHRHSVDAHPDSQISIYDTFDGALVSITISTGTPIQIFVNAIGILPPLVDPALLIEELSVWHNYGIVSDFLRFEIISHIGGIYMDLDTYMQSRTPLPLKIYAPRGILFAEVQSNGTRTMATPIVASAQRHLVLRKIAKALEATYDQEYPPAGHGVRAFSTQNQQRLSHVQQLRKTRDYEIATQGKPSMYTDIEFNLFFVTPTLNRAGGWLPKIDSRSVTDAVVLEYSFQNHAAYELTIKNESTWYK